MARIRLPGVLSAGLAGGIPLATQGILEVLKMRSREEESAADRAIRERSLRLQEETHTRTEGEAQERLQARRNVGANLGVLSQAFQPVPAQAPVFGEIPETAEESMGGIAPPILQPGVPARQPTAQDIIGHPAELQARQPLRQSPASSMRSAVLGSS